MIRLFYVDDQTDFLGRLKSKLSSMPGPALELKDYVGPNDPVDRFMKEFKGSPPSTEDYFLLDINMVVPHSLKRDKDVWPAEVDNHNQICGIALAKWLVKQFKLKAKNIAFFTHWHKMEQEHQEIIQKLGLQGSHYLKKDLSDIGAWLEKIATSQKGVQL
jgi:hypothetical protein